MTYFHSEGYLFELRCYYIETVISIHVVINEYGDLINRLRINRLDKVNMMRANWSKMGL